MQFAEVDKIDFKIEEGILTFTYLGVMIIMLTYMQFYEKSTERCFL